MLVIRSVTLEGAMEGIAFFLAPDFSKITGQSIIYALGQAFFSLSLGIAIMITYSSYLQRDVNLPSSAASVAGFNIFVSF